MFVIKSYSGVFYLLTVTRILKTWEFLTLKDVSMTDLLFHFNEPSPDVNFPGTSTRFPNQPAGKALLKSKSLTLMTLNEFAKFWRVALTTEEINDLCLFNDRTTPSSSLKTNVFTNLSFSINLNLRFPKLSWITRSFLKEFMTNVTTSSRLLQ